MTTDSRKPATRLRASALVAALQDVTDVVPRKDTAPILAHVLLEARDGVLHLTATNLDMWVVRSVPTDDRDGPASKDWLASIRPFTITLPAKALLAVVKELDGDAMVTITAPAPGEARATISAGRARFRLLCLAPEDMPVAAPFDVAHSMAMPCTTMGDAIARVRHAISTEETRYYLNGIYMHPEGLGLRFVATDGHRLALLTIDGPDGAASWPGVIVARQTVALLAKLLDEAVKAADKDGTPPELAVDATADGSRMSWELPAAGGGDVRVIAKAVDGTFPDYMRVIPAAPVHDLTIERVALAEAAKRVAVVVQDKSRALKLELDDDRVVLDAAAPELGDAREELPCQYAGPPMTLALDARYLRETLGAIGADTVTIKLTDGGLPLRFEAESADQAPALVQVIVPLRV